jgi:hypothetical protein
MRDLRPVIRKPVCFAYQGSEIFNLAEAASKFPPFHLQVGLSDLRIDYFSLTSRDWLCGFSFFRNKGTISWNLELIEYDPEMTLKRALRQLGELEQQGLHQVKYGIAES